MGDEHHYIYLEDPRWGLWHHYHQNITLISVQHLIVNMEPSNVLPHFPALGT